MTKTPRPKRSGRKPAEAALLAYIDGGARGNPGPAGYGVFITRVAGAPPAPEAVAGDAPTLAPIAEIYGYLGIATNNTAEYAALLALLEHVGPLQPARLTIRSDSELLVRQMKGEYRVKDPKLQILHAAARRLAATLPVVVFEHVRRELNKDADALANRAMDLCDSSGPLPEALDALPAGSRQTNLPTL